jgi:pimeloyl-ACP methyl ester carboxylesterase
MALPSIGQAEMLAAQFALLIKRLRPASVAIVGCAGGNGLNRIDPGQLERVVAIDINPASTTNCRPIRKRSTKGRGSITPSSMRDRMPCMTLSKFGAFNQDAIDNKALLAKVGKLNMPVLALGAEKSLGAGEAETLRFVASNVTGGIVPDSGHWIMEENPQATIKLVTEFLAK